MDNPNRGPYVALGMGEHIYVARSEDNGRTFSAPVQVSHEKAIVLDIERPAIAATDDGRVTVAWSSSEYSGSILYAVSRDGAQTFSPALKVSGDPKPETVLVRMTFDDEANPVLA